MESQMEMEEATNKQYIIFSYNYITIFLHFILLFSKEASITLIKNGTKGIYNVAKDLYFK